MNIRRFLTLYFISLPVFVLIDAVWLGLIAGSFYEERIGHLMQISWGPAVLFYLLFLLGLTYFSTYPAITKNFRQVFFNGALFGFFCYMTYDLTNLATIKDWPVDMVIIDIIWGSVLGGLVALVTHYFYFLKN
jgi:uncharacterized membrane protein